MEAAFEEDIDRQQESFKLYLQHFLLDSASWELLQVISKQTDVYVFSGVIRNFLIGYIENRDLDIVIGNINDLKLPIKYLKSIKIARNSFGGYKVNIGQLVIDVWDIKNTWGLKNLNLHSSPENLIQTVFFNFSAIVYDFNHERFIYDNNFILFYRTHAMDVLYEKNPDIPLCIVNTFYYAIKYSFTIKYNLCKWIVEHFDPMSDFTTVQLRHFKYEYFDSEFIEVSVKSLKRLLPILRQNKDTKAVKLEFRGHLSRINSLNR